MQIERRLDLEYDRDGGLEDMVILLGTAAGVWVLLEIVMPYLYGCEMQGLRQIF